MTKKSKSILYILSIFIVSIIIYFKFFKGRASLNTGVDLVKKENSFSVYCNTDRVVANNVDSIIVAGKYGTMIHGIGAKSNIKQWIYIDGSSVKSIYDGYSSEELRTQAILSIGKEYLDSIKTAKYYYWELIEKEN